MLKKLLLTLMALFLILVGGLILTMGYVFNHPESIFNAFNSVTAKITQGEPYEEKAEYFLQGIKDLRIYSRHSHVQILPYSENTLKIELSGKIPRFERGPFLVQGGDVSNLSLKIQEPLASNWVHININGHETSSVSDSALIAKVYMPKNFKGDITIESTEGEVEVLLPKDKLYEFELQSETGLIKNESQGRTLDGINPAEVGKMRILTTSGAISIKNSF